MRIAMLLHKSVEFDSRVRREAGALAVAGHEVFVLELGKVPEAAIRLEGFTRRSCAPRAWMRRALPGPVYRAITLLSFVRGIVRLRPQVVHAHDAAMLLPAVLGARLTGALLVYDSHELATGVPYRERGWAWLVGAIEAVIVPRCTAVITVSDGIADRLQERYGLEVRPTVVRNVSALEPVGEGGLRRRLGVGRDTPLVLHQGAPAPDRGCEILVEAARQLDGVHFVFLGDPDPGYREHLERAIASLRLGDRVSLLPSVPLDQLLASSAEADVGVTLLQDTCENHRLALPNKLFEYIAAGVPVIASALPETQALVDGYGIGWCVKPDDPDQLADALRRAFGERDDPRLRDRLARAATELRWPREQLRLLDLYGLLQDGPRSAVEGGQRDAARPKVMLLVRNTVSHDARVLRAARTAARALDAETLVVGMAGEREPPGKAVVEGVRVLRLATLGKVSGRGSAARRQRLGGSTGIDSSATRPEPAGLPARARLRRISVGAWYFVRVVAIAGRLRPQLVHANDWNTMWAGVAVKLLFGSRLVYDSHELWPDRNGRWENKLWLLVSEALFVRAADAVLTTSPGHAQTIATRHHVACPLVVRNIPEWDAAEDGPLAEPPRIAYIGGLMPGRGLEQMIEALPHLPEVVLRAIGPGADRYRNLLLAHARRLGVDDRLELYPPVPPPAVAEALRGAALGLCLIQPICRSYELSLPNKLLEYAAAGLPVLASDLPVIAQVVREHELGVVVSASDPRSIAAGVRHLLDADTRSAAIAGAHRFMAESGWARESDLLADVYTGWAPRAPALAR